MAAGGNNAGDFCNNAGHFCNNSKVIGVHIGSTM
jgi:hypothetical protein